MFLECVCAAISGTAGNLATEYASPYLRYFFRFGEIVEDFKNRRNELESKRDELKDAVDEALRQTEVIKKGVEEWLTKADKELGEAQSLEEEIERNKCFNWCPSWGWRYCLSKKVAKKNLCISKLLETCNFPLVGQRPPLQGIEFLLPKDFMRSESSTLAFNGIMKALKGDGVNVIGLHGMPGVGKTTLAEVVGKQATEEKLFDKVVIVRGVSQNPDINKIQHRISEILGLKFNASTEEGKAEELFKRLKGEKKILIILDDVWEQFELRNIGIPSGDKHPGCKILLTTRLRQVCSQMNCQEEFKLNILSEDEAWALFKDNAGLKDASPTLNDVAKEVAREAKGLPLAIVTMAKALKRESLNGWIAANQRLKESRHLDNQDVCGGIYSCLKLSYDYLKEENIQSCFLLCSLFPEDYDINVELLTEFGIGQGLFCHINLIEEIRREIHLALSKLQKFGLLLETDDEFYVKMHDVVRDFAHWITSRGENMFMVKNELTEWPKSEIFGCYTTISLWNIKIVNFPDKLEFSKLKTLFLTGEDYLRVPSKFFEGMKTLRVLFLQRVVFSMEALQFLTNLRTLCIMRCDVENISSLRNLENLESLSLIRTYIDELPEELVELRRLKSLYIFWVGDEDRHVPPNLISRLTSLQELHMLSFTIANLSELNSLSRLTALTLTVSTDQCFQENFVFPKLQSYNIGVNGYIEIPRKLISRILRIRDSSSLNAFKELFRNVERLSLENIMEHKTVVPNVDQWGLNELTSLQLTSCDDLECLIDTTREQSPATAFSNLVNLDIGKMTSLKELCHGQLPNSFLQHLETLIICDCGQLQSVFQMNGCMWSISNLRSLELQSLPALESIWKEPTHLVSLQNLKDVKVDGCDKLKSIFSPCLAQSLLHLEQLKISACKKLEQVFAFAQDMAELEDRSLLCWPKLKSLVIASCESLRYVFPITLAQGLPHLESVQIIDCPQLMHVFNMAKEEYGHDILLPRLQSLRLEYLLNFRNFCPRNYFVMLPSLKGFQACSIGLPRGSMTRFHIHEGLWSRSLLMVVLLYFRLFQFYF
ncbi:PREDICTED: probable disease resistance protein At4g27220 [Theobroma cacao]|uniref:Probable disease resistance protein At4g27220 n=1 Tax=Theobroma cacao TaxID=3641 RepID=A0AB32WRI0_THECC|nr:PREDICTED: probable disease resistance protein At4g27220 [Theobroma cacao]